MSAIFTLRNGVLLCMGLAIIFGAFAPVTPDVYAAYLKAGAVAATGLAGLFMHPPSLGGDPVPPKPATVTGPALVAIPTPPTPPAGAA